jgi:hypothetical protein
MALRWAVVILGRRKPAVVELISTTAEESAGVLLPRCIPCAWIKQVAAAKKTKRERLIRMVFRFTAKLQRAKGFYVKKSLPFSAGVGFRPGWG